VNKYGEGLEYGRHVGKEARCLAGGDSEAKVGIRAGYVDDAVRAFLDSEPSSAES